MTQTIIKNCSILDVKAKKVREGRSILINGPRIEKIGTVESFKDLETKLPEGSIYETDGRIVLPGLIDTHVHLCIVREPSISKTVLENLRATETLKVLYGARHARETLEAGFTTVRDMGQGDNLALREAIQNGAVMGPRMVVCRWMGVTSGHGEQMATEWDYNVPLRKEDVGVDGPWEIRKKVRKLVGQGADFIKTYTTSAGYKPHPFYPYWLERPNYTMEELEALVDEAHASGRRVAVAGFTNPIGTKNAILAGIDTLEHGLVLDEQDVGEMRERGIYYVPTLAMTDRIWNVDETEDGEFFQIRKEDAKRYLEAQWNSFKIAREAGVKIAMGSDAFRVMGHGENALEFEIRVKAGMSEMEALVSATILSAEALGIESMVGSIEEGKFADLLVVDPDPLKDISILLDKNNLKVIMKNGDVVCSRM